MASRITCWTSRDVRYPANVAEYQRLARAAIAGVQARGRVPILAGGSGLYLRAALDDLNFPGTDPVVRQRLEDELSQHGPAALYTRLAGLDPAAAQGILPSNGRRIVRALEVIEVSGQPFTATLPSYESLYPVIQLGLRVPRAELDRRIGQRVARMWQAGLVAEVRALAAHGLREGRTASRALGYAQVLRFLAGEWAEQQAQEETVTATRRFARRQDAWFRRDPRISWLDAGSSTGQQGGGEQGGGEHGAGQHGAGQHGADQDTASQHGADLARRALATIGTCGPLTSSSPRGTAPRTTS